MNGMAATPYVKALDDIQKALTAFLKPLGFKKKGRSYNRHVSDGLVQVVNLQMGQFPIGDYVIPGLRESHYGRFTVNLGVALELTRFRGHLTVGFGGVHNGREDGPVHAGVQATDGGSGPIGTDAGIAVEGVRAFRLDDWVVGQAGGT
jgi:hypothetical protein